MTKTQTVQELLDQFGLELDLSSEVLSLEVEGDYDSFEVIQQPLACINSKGHRSYGLFECYHFENDKYYCTIVPDNVLRMIIVAEKIDSDWYCVCFDRFGQVSARS